MIWVYVFDFAEPEFIDSHPPLYKADSQSQMVWCTMFHEFQFILLFSKKKKNQLEFQMNTYFIFRYSDINFIDYIVIDSK